MFVTRNEDGKIDGAYRKLQTKQDSLTEPLFEQQEVPDDDPELLAFLDPDEDQPPS